MKRFFPFWPLAAFAVVCASAQTPVFTTGQAARLVIGQKNFTQAEFGATTKLLGSPSGVALFGGTLWVVDSNRLGATPNNNRVLRFSDVSTYPSPTDSPEVPGSTCGVCRGDASLVLGQPDFITANPNLSATGLRNPTAVATDGKILVVADTDNNRVLIWNNPPTVNGQPANVVIGQKDFSSNATSVPPTQTSLRGPTGVWLTNGKLFIADAQDNRVLIYNKIPTSNNAPADVVVGQTSFTSFVQPDLTQNQIPPSASNMQTPVSVTSDGVRMFVADLAQNRILIWNTIPTTNGAAADVEIGQPDMTTGISNNAFTGIAAASTTDTNKETPVLCPTATGSLDSANNPTYYTRCAATISFPRFALSDGTRLFVADGGNDRILIYNNIPTQNAAVANVILGQPDEFSDNTGDNPDGSNALQTPVSLAWTGTDLYASDTYNRRILVYSPANPNIGLNGARNAASKQIYAIGSVTIGGAIQAKDTVTVTINGTDYAYAIDATKDTLVTVVQNLVSQINKAPDPNVTASANISQLEVELTAKVPGTPGGLITLTATASTTSTASSSTQTAGTPLITATANSASLNIYLQNPSQIAPMTLIQVTGQDLCVGTGSADLTQQYAPRSIEDCALFIDGLPAPLISISPTQIVAQMPGEFVDRTSVSLYARSVRPSRIVVTTPIAVTIVPQNPGLFALDGTDPRPGILYHASANAIGMVSVDGSIQAGDTAIVTINSVDYSYAITATDTLATVRDGLINAINSRPDPFATASASNEYTRIVLRANIPGPIGEGVTVAVNQTATTSSTITGPLITLTAFNATLCCSNTAGAQVTLDNPAIPGEALYTFSTGIGVTEPSNIDTGLVFPGGSSNPPAVPVDSILTGGLTANPIQVSLTPGTVGVYFVEFLLNTGLPNNNQTQLTIAQQAFVSNVVIFPVAGPGSAERFTVQPEVLTAAVGVPVNFDVTAVAPNGTASNAYAGTVHFTSDDPTAVLPADTTLLVGLGTFPVTFNTPGYHYVIVNDTAAPNVTGTSPSINVTAAGASAIPAPAALRGNSVQGNGPRRLPWLNRR
jgi:uncharacterized protein (TIGR03437 family)